MKKTFFLVLLCATPVVNFAQQFIEHTTESWLHPNLSVETTSSQIFTAFTDRHATYQHLSPTVKITDLNGSPITSFFIDLGQDVTLMDFAVNESRRTLLFTGFFNNIPNRIFVVETTTNGTIVQSAAHTIASQWQAVPHQIIYSEQMDQVVIVGTTFSGELTPYNYTTIDKSGFVLGLSLDRLNSTSLFTLHTETPGASTDNDMLENIVEVPNQGYVMTGSANNPFTGSQNLHLMQIDYNGSPIYDDVYDVYGQSNGTSVISNNLVGASVMYFDSQVYVLANSGAVHQFEIIRYNPSNQTFTGNFKFYQPAGIDLGNGVDMNGFKLQHTPHDILVGGYLSVTNGSMNAAIHPFQATLSADLNSILSFNVFPAGNNFDLPGYFSETGSSVYINTPDMMAYTNDKVFTVNQNTDLVGYDLNISHPTSESHCKTQYNSTVATSEHLKLESSILYHVIWLPGEYGAFNDERTISQQNICRRSASANITASVNAELYPNPVNDLLTINSEEVILSARITDLNGALVREVTNNEQSGNEWNINVSDFKTGVYLIELQNAEGESIRERFVKK